MKLLCRFVDSSELFAVARHEDCDFAWGLCKMQSGSVHFLLQVDELGKVFEMRCLLFHLLPQVLNRIEVRRVGRQLFDGQTVGMGLEKRFHGLTGVIPSPILNHHDMLRGVREDIA